MKTCYNCYWKEQCEKCEGFDNRRCEDYDPILGERSAPAIEYEKALTERVDTYQEIINEQQGFTED